MLTPPPELIVIKLLDGAPFRSNQIHERDRWLIEHAYNAGADAELEACCELVDSYGWDGCAEKLRAARRPKPPSLKEQALEAARIELIAGGKNAALIIRALEALPDD